MPVKINLYGGTIVMYNASEIATLTGLNVRTAKQYLSDGIIPSQLVGKHRLCSEDALVSWLNGATPHRTRSQAAKAQPERDLEE